MNRQALDRSRRVPVTIERSERSLAGQAIVPAVSPIVRDVIEKADKDDGNNGLDRVVWDWEAVRAPRSGLYASRLGKL
jgi:hypothetical protein